MIACRHARRRRCSPQCAPLPRRIGRLADRQQCDVPRRRGVGPVADGEQRSGGARLGVRLRTDARGAAGRTACRSGGSSTLAGGHQPRLGRLDPDPPDGPLKRAGVGDLRGDGALRLRDRPDRSGGGRTVHRDARAAAAPADERPAAGHPGDGTAGRPSPRRGAVRTGRRGHRRRAGCRHLPDRRSRGIETAGAAPPARPGTGAVGERALGRGQAHPDHPGVVDRGGGGDRDPGHLRSRGRGAVRPCRGSARATRVPGGAHRAARCRVDPRRALELAARGALGRSTGGDPGPGRFRGRQPAEGARLAPGRAPRVADPRIRPALRVPSRALARAAYDAHAPAGTRLRRDLPRALRTFGPDAGARRARDRSYKLQDDLCWLRRGRGPDRGLACSGCLSAARSRAPTASRYRW